MLYLEDEKNSQFFHLALKILHFSQESFSQMKLSAGVRLPVDEKNRRRRQLCKSSWQGEG